MNPDRAAIVHVLKAQRDALKAHADALDVLIAVLEAEAAPTAATNPAPIAAPRLMPMQAPATRKGKGGRPRKHFIDRDQPATGAERMAISRHVAKLNGQVSQHVSQQSLSLEDNNYKQLEREYGEASVAKRVEAISQPRISQQMLVPLPVDFQPDPQGMAIAIERLGEIGAANLIANFRDHYSDDPRLLTPRQWQRLFRETWAKREWLPAQPSLPLMASVPKVAKQDAVSRKVYLKIDSPQGEAWKRHTGKSFPHDRGGGWWFDSDWPPDHDAASQVRQAS